MRSDIRSFTDLENLGEEKSFKFWKIIKTPQLRSSSARPEILPERVFLPRIAHTECGNRKAADEVFFSIDDAFASP